MNSPVARLAGPVHIALPALFALMTACSATQETPLTSTVCELSTHAEHTVQVQATVSVDSAGNAVIGDAQCPAMRLALQLTGAAARAGAAEQLQAAAKQAVSDGKTSFTVTLTGVYRDAAGGAQFATDSVSIPAPR